MIYKEDYFSNYIPTTVDELLHSGFNVERDSFGDYRTMTGYEGIGNCFWCGRVLQRERQRYCRQGLVDRQHGLIAHWLEYYRHFNWTFARAWCFERYEKRCANCNRVGSEMHHIIPLEGTDRGWSYFNLPWNLILFCHDCHQEVHAVMREVSRPPAPDIFDVALGRGQQVFEIMESK